MELKSILESILFVNEKPVSLEECVHLLGRDRKEIEAVFEQMIKECEERKAGLCIVKVAGGYQMCSLPANVDWIKKFYKDKFKQKLSNAALESLAIIAYKQPATKLEIESIRGVNTDGVINHLSKLGLIKIVGKKQVIGRPFMYGTTRQFLEYFGLNSLQELPPLGKDEAFGGSLKEVAFEHGISMSDDDGPGFSEEKNQVTGKAADILEEKIVDKEVSGIPPKQQNEGGRAGEDAGVSDPYGDV